MENLQEKALRPARNVLKWTDDAIHAFTSKKSLPEPLACKPGCHYCCFNLPMVTPPEALLVGHHVTHRFVGKEQQRLMEKIKKVLRMIEDKPPEDILMMRHDLPCIFLREGLCAVYPLRPVVCRTCNSTSADHCKTIFERKNHRARLRCYHRIREIFHSAQESLVDRCQQMGVQSDFLFMATAVHDFLKHPKPIEAWLQGETVFKTLF